MPEADRPSAAPNVPYREEPRHLFLLYGDTQFVLVVQWLFSLLPTGHIIPKNKSRKSVNIDSLITH